MCGVVAKSRLAARLRKTFLFPCCCSGGRGSGRGSPQPNSVPWNFSNKAHRALDESVASEANERATLNCTKFREDLLKRRLLRRLDTTASVQSAGFGCICALTKSAWVMQPSKKVFLFFWCLAFFSLAHSFWLTLRELLFPPLFRNVLALGLGWKLWNKEEERAAFVLQFSFPSWFLCGASGFLFESF